MRVTLCVCVCVCVPACVPACVREYMYVRVFDSVCERERERRETPGYTIVPFS